MNNLNETVISTYFTYDNSVSFTSGISATEPNFLSLATWTQRATYVGNPMIAGASGNLGPCVSCNTSVSLITTPGRRWIGTQDPKAIAQARVAHFADLQPNWDGYGASRISDRAVQNTVNILTLTSGRLPEPDVTPNPNGTLTLEWQYAQSYAMLEVGKTRFSLVIDQPNSDPILVGGLVGQINANTGYVGESISSLLEPTPVSIGNTVLLDFHSYTSP